MICVNTFLLYICSNVILNRPGDMGGVIRNLIMWLIRFRWSSHGKTILNRHFSMLTDVLGLRLTRYFDELVCFTRNIVFIAFSNSFSDGKNASNLSLGVCHQLLQPTSLVSLSGCLEEFLSGCRWWSLPFPILRLSRNHGDWWIWMPRGQLPYNVVSDLLSYLLLAKQGGSYSWYNVFNFLVSFYLITASWDDPKTKIKHKN